MSPTEYQELVTFIGTMQEQIDGNHREALGHFDEVYCRLERLDQEYVATTRALHRPPSRTSTSASWPAPAPSSRA